MKCFLCVISYFLFKSQPVSLLMPNRCFVINFNKYTLLPTANRLSVYKLLCSLFVYIHAYMPVRVYTGLTSIFNTLEVLDMFHQIQSTNNQGKNYFSHILNAAGKTTFLLTILY